VFAARAALRAAITPAGVIRLGGIAFAEFHRFERDGVREPSAEGFAECEAIALAATSLSLDRRGVGWRLDASEECHAARAALARNGSGRAANESE
jgi:hypothetical protein